MSKIPKPALLKTPVAAASNKENAPSVAGPSRLPPSKAIMKRRSKSFASMREITSRVLSTKAFNVLPKVPSKPVLNKEPMLKRSNTILGTDRARTVAKPPAKPTIATTSTAPRVAAKRPAAPTFKAPSEPKVAKVIKPAPYDYKARYNLLLPKYKELQQKFSSASDDVKKIPELEELINSLECEISATKTKLETLDQDHRTLQEKHEEVLKEREEVGRRFAETERSLISTKKQYKTTLEEVKVTREELGRLKNEYAELKTDKAKTDRQLGDLQEKYESAMTECKLLKENVAKLEKNLQLFKNENEELKNYKIAYMTNETQCRKLHNLVQDLKGNIRVFCRVRPRKETEDDKFEYNINYVDEHTLEIRKDRESFSISGKPTDLKQDFTFDRVFPPDSTQAEVFEDLSQLVQSALDGYHVCVFAYGQTGSGKTFTMQGEQGQEGMIPRSVRLLFTRIKELEKVGWKYTVHCSVLEIYNEIIKDLLNPNEKMLHEIRYNEGKGTTVTNLSIKPVSSMADLMTLINKAQQNRAVAATDFNEHSSRSHFVAKISIQGQNSQSNSKYIGSINLVDLAGSESAKTTTKDRIAETKNINKSLSALGNVMLALYNKENHIPYRNSKLTYLLQSCLGGNSKTLMFVNIAPLDDCYNESINSLRFASTVKEVKSGVKRNRQYFK